jgi:hypothetical protein
MAHKLQFHENINHVTVCKCYTMKMYGDVKVKFHTLLTSALDGSECSTSCWTL